MTDSSAILNDPLLGSVIDQKYHIHTKLGEGGMGLVYQATQLGLDRPVAVKLLRLDQSHLSESAERLAREARTIARLDNPHIVQVLDFGRLPSGHPFLVLEYLTGETLSERLARSGPLPLEEAIAFAIQAINGLVAAHRRGIVHRDLKPENLFLAQGTAGERVVKLLDFGISKQTDHGISKLTQPHVSLGSPQYMAPEQVLAGDVDTRADIWGLGVVLYELATGFLPFDGISLPEVCARIVQATPLPPSHHRPDLPRAFDELVLACLEKSPSARPQDPLEVALALRRCLNAPRRSSTSTQIEPVTVDCSRHVTTVVRSRKSPARFLPPWLAPIAICALAAVPAATVGRYAARSAASGAPAAAQADWARASATDTPPALSAPARSTAPVMPASVPAPSATSVAPRPPPRPRVNAAARRVVPAVSEQPAARAASPHVDNGLPDFGSRY